MFVVIGILVLAVVYAHNKMVSITADATVQAGGSPTTLPPPSPVAATGNAQSPSPATWGGAPGAASSYAIKLWSNASYPNVGTTGLVDPTNPNLPGVPTSAVPASAFNGYDAVPASTKELSVNRLPRRTLQGRGLGGTKI